MRKQAVLLIVALLAGTLSVASRGMSVYLTVISCTGDVKALNVGVYWDQNCTQTVTSIDWGMIEPGAHVNKTIYAKNEGNAPIILYLNTTNWTPPEAEKYLSLTWNYTGESLQPTQVYPVTLTLSVAQNVTAITSFNFDIVIRGEG